MPTQITFNVPGGDNKPLRLFVPEALEQVQSQLLESGWAEVTAYGDRHAVVNGVTVAYMADMEEPQAIVGDTHAHYR